MFVFLCVCVSGGGGWRGGWARGGGAIPTLIMGPKVILNSGSMKISQFHILLAKT